jgi:hypothetical protein
MIKRFLLLFFILWSMCVSAYSQASGLADLKFGQYQIADSQWNVQSCTQTATCQIYSKNPGTVYQIPWYNGQLTWAAGDYVKFVATGDATDPWNAIQYTANGTQKAVMGTGHIINMGSDYFFFVGNDNDTGQLFSMTSGFATTSGVTWTGTLNPTVAQVNQYATGGSTTPLAAGQTVQPSAPASPTVTGTVVTYTWRQVVTGNVTRLYRTKVTTTNYSDNTSTNASDPEILYSTATSTVTDVSSSNTQQGVVTTTTTRVDTVMGDGSQTTSYSSSSATTPWPNYVTIGSGNVSNNIVIDTVSNITTPQQNKVTTWTNKTVTDGNKIYIDQIGGNSNTVTMEQDGNKNLINATIDGSTNAITVKQGAPGVGQNEIKLGVTGSYNALDISQARNNQGAVTGTNGHYHDVTVNGLNNTLTTQQSNTGGIGGHFMETTINGNQNNVTARQTDNGNKIMFNSITGTGNTVDAVQKGTGQHYLDTKITGNNNSVNALQEGTTANRATLDLTSAGGPASILLQQNGGQNVTVTTTCATAGGCAPITIRQGY